MSRSATNGLDPVLHRLRPTEWDLFFESPSKYLANYLHSLAQRRQPPQYKQSEIKIVCVSENHNFQTDIPYADVLIHTGVSQGGWEKLNEVLSWLRTLPHPHKITIPSPSYALSRLPERTKLDWTGVTFLEDDSTKINFPNGRELNIFGRSGMSHSGRPGYWGTFENDGWKGSVPPDTDVLISHVSPISHVMLGRRSGPYRTHNKHLLTEMWRTKPRLQVSCDEWVEDGRGKENLVYDDFQLLFEKIRYEPGSPKVCFWLVAMFVRFLGFVVWRPRSGSEAILVNTSAKGRVGVKTEEKPVVVYL